MKTKSKIIISILAVILIVSSLLIVKHMLDNRATHDGFVIVEITRNDEVLESIELGFNIGDSLVDLLEESNLKFVFQDSQLGKYVIGILDITPGEFEFWAFYVDDASSEVGVSMHTLTDGEKLTFSLESWA